MASPVAAGEAFGAGDSAASSASDPREFRAAAPARPSKEATATGASAPGGTPSGRRYGR